MFPSHDPGVEKELETLESIDLEGEANSTLFLGFLLEEYSSMIETAHETFTYTDSPIISDEGVDTLLHFGQTADSFEFLGTNFSFLDKNKAGENVTPIELLNEHIQYPGSFEKWKKNMDTAIQDLQNQVDSLTFSIDTLADQKAALTSEFNILNQNYQNELKKQEQVNTALAAQNPRFYITFGTGNTYSGWSPVISMVLIRSEYKYDGKGSRVIDLYFKPAGEDFLQELDAHDVVNTRYESEVYSVFDFNSASLDQLTGFMGANQKDFVNHLKNIRVLQVIDTQGGGAFGGEDALKAGTIVTGKQN